MNQALDDIISKQRSIRGRSARGGGGGPRRGRGMARGRAPRGFGPGFRGSLRQAGSYNNATRQIPEGRWRHDKFVDTGFGLRTRMGGAGSMNATSKLLISNLDFGVSDSDIQELFGEFGPLRKASVHYDKSGRSLGSADVVFERRVDASRAMKQYDNVPLDGRAMKIQLVGPSPGTANIPQQPAGLNTYGGIRPRQPRGAGARRGRAGFGGGASAGGRGGRGGARGRGGRTKEPQPTIEDLDKELDAYVNKMD